MAEPGLALINLENQDAFVFQFFPNSVRTSDRNNWEPQETTIGVKPLFYANREPRQIDFPELWFDSTIEGNQESLTPEIKKLRSLMDESVDSGMPPALLAVWGDRNERCVLLDLSIEETFFHAEGHPIRARITLSLLQLQSDKGESTSVEVLPDDKSTRPRRVIDGSIFIPEGTRKIDESIFLPQGTRPRVVK